MKISYYNPPITNVMSNKTLTLNETFEMIKGGQLKEPTERLRVLSGNEKAEFKKKCLPGVTFSGEFAGTRCDKNLVEHSSMMVVDIDNLLLQELAIAKHMLTLLIYKNPIVAFFVSPSGNGLKILVKVDHKKFSQKENYEAAIYLLINITRIGESKFDKSGSNVARLCFLCHDKYIMVNEKAKGDDIAAVNILDTEVWLTKAEKQLTIEKANEKLNMDMFDTSKDEIIYSMDGKLDFQHKNAHINFTILLVYVLKKCGKYQRGNRHNYIQMLASYANKFGMDQQQLLEYTTSHFKEHESTKDILAPFNLERELTPIITDTYNRYKDQFASWKEPQVAEEFETPCFPESVYEKLPPFLRDSCSKFEIKRECDVYLLAALGVLSNCFPLVQGCYDQKFISMHMFILLVAPASAGKGNMSWARKLGKPFDKYLKEKYKQEMEEYEILIKQYEAAKGEDKGAKPIKPVKQKFFLAANSSTASLITSMHNNSFQGLIFESESDSLSNMLKNDWGNYSDILRKAFHHEPIQQQRRTNEEDLEIEKSYLSTVLSGTPSQATSLLSSVENGLFSRIILYDFPQNIIIKNVFAKRDVSLETYFDGISNILFSYAKPFFTKVEDDFSNQVLFELTIDQQQRFDIWLKQKMIQLHHIYGDDIVPSIKRLGVCFFKISMILSTLRFIENKINTGNSIIGKEITCKDIDYENTEVIINTLLYHTVKVFRGVKKLKRNKYAASLKDSYYKHLPMEFDRTIARETAALIGIKDKTAEGYLADFVEAGIILKPKHNHYVKAA